MDIGGVGIEAVAAVAVLAAVVAFFYSNLGLGGGQLYVPIMVICFASAGMGMKDIVPLSLTFAFVTMASSAFTHAKKGLVDFKLGIQLSIAGLIGVVAGVLFTSNIDDSVIKAAFAVMLVVVATKMIYDIYKGKKDNSGTPFQFSTKLVLGGMGVSIITGFLIGSFGVGGGVVSVPLIIYVFKSEPRRAIGTSALMGAILTPAAFVAYALNSAQGVVIHYDIAIVLAPIVLVFALIGSTWGLEKLRTKTVKTIFTCGVYLAAAVMIFNIIFQ